MIGSVLFMAVACIWFGWSLSDLLRGKRERDADITITVNGNGVHVKFDKTRVIEHDDSCIGMTD